MEWLQDPGLKGGQDMIIKTTEVFKHVNLAISESTTQKHVEQNMK